MEPKHGTVRLDAAAEWLSKTTGRTFTADDLIDAHNKLPIYALIPKSLARPEYSAAVCHAVQKKAVEVAEAADRMAKKAPLKQVDVVELATETLPEDVALRYKWEKTAHEEGVYLLSARDLELLDIHGVQQLHRGVSIFNRWVGRPIQFGNAVDVTLDMLCVRRSQLLKFAELVALEQAGNPAEPVREKEAEPRIDGLQTHQGQAAEMTPRKRAAIIKSLGRRYPALESALNRPEEWAKACRVPKELSPDGKQGWYYLERIEDQCRARYGATAQAPVVDPSPTGQLHCIGK